MINQLKKTATDQTAALECAIAHREAGRYKESVLIIQDWLVRNPQDAGAHSLLAQLLSLDKQDDPAWVAINTALSINPFLSVVQRNHARLLLKRQKPAEALQAAQTAYEVDVMDPENQLVLAGTLAANGQSEQALRLLNDALRSRPNYAEALANRALLKLRSGDSSGALADAEQSLSIKPHLYQLWSTVGLLRHQYKNIPGAIEALEKALDYEPENVGHLVNLGKFKRQAGMLNAAIALLEKAVAIQPGNPAAWVNLGAALQKSNKIPEAKEAYLKSVELAPDQAEVINNLGVLAKEEGLWADALHYFDQALHYQPTRVGFMTNRAAVLNALGRHDEAEQLLKGAIDTDPPHNDVYFELCNALIGKKEYAGAKAVLDAMSLPASSDSDIVYSQYLSYATLFRAQNLWHDAETWLRKALKIKPDSAEAYNNLGNTMQSMGLLEDARVCYCQALEIKQEYAEASNNLGVMNQSMGRLQEAKANFNWALQHRPHYSEAMGNLGITLKNMGCFKEAEDSYCSALKIKPDSAEVLNNLAAMLQELGRLDEAETCYKQSIALKPNNRIRVACDLMLPPIMGTKDEVLASRARFEENLDRLIAEGVMLEDQAEASFETNFYLAYHGLNDKGLQQKVAGFYEKACPSLLYTAPHCTINRDTGSKLRIGFLSKYIFKHSVSICYNWIIEHLGKNENYEIMLISNHDHQEQSAQQMYRNFVGRHIHLPNNLFRARAIIAEQELDILVYLDIGMDPMSFSLAFARLARIQCVLPGHPVTTGIRNIDYYVSFELSEPADAEMHYSEKLVCLPFGMFYFERPVLPATFKSRKELGLPEEGRIYSCPMVLQKIHPDFDEAIARILQLDDDGYVIMFQDRMRTTWMELLEKRFDRTIPDNVRNRVKFLPWVQDNFDFLGIIAASDVILDPFHFGVGSTLIATFAVGTPLVTCPGEFMRGRVGLLHCTLLDILECVATDTEDYVQKAVAIATDQSLRKRIRTKILEKNHIFFENQQGIKDAEDLFAWLSRHELCS